MRRVAEESQRFPQQEVPPRQHEKERVIRAYQDIERTLRDSGESLDRDLMPESLDRNWQQMMMLYQERHQIIQDEIARYGFFYFTTRKNDMMNCYKAYS